MNAQYLAAHHEAGHALMTQLVGGSVTRVTLSYCNFSAPAAHLPLIFAAGKAAEQLAAGKKRREGTEDSDRWEFDQRSPKTPGVTRDMQWVAAVAQAREILSKRLDALGAIAMLLEKNGELNGPTVRKLLR